MSEGNDIPKKPTAPPDLPPASIDEAEAPIDKMALEPLGRTINFANVVDALLKTPGRLFFEMQEGETKKVVINLGIIAIGSLALFGLILGLFSGGTQLWAVPLKIAAGGLFAAVITLPSLYVFSCLNGMDMTLRKAATMLLAGLALIGLILTALVPVAWIFSQSTESASFMGLLALAFWMIAICFGGSLVFRGASVSGVNNPIYIVVWAAVFALVTIQLSTSLRPLIGAAEETLLPAEKRFFLEHWVKSLEVVEKR
ncbi:MAG: hypothetical protein CMO61_11280 [Verrucomicrobiales bacterium]|jgi:hypothetical protein|nr:hypothetical protein [Verrucomicrobiales bacterium]|tara:strand:+ start:14507 stop:15274 length:768 start_codon:yes stop_codon:yes gene_type:complete